MFAVQATIEPESQQGHCKVDAPCKLNIRVQRLQWKEEQNELNDFQLRLEVTADPTLWTIQVRDFPLP